MEIWKDVPGYEGLYQVSDTGKVKSLQRKVNSVNGRVYTYKEKLLKGNHNIARGGYMNFGLTKNGKTKVWKAHRVVMLAFVGECPEGKEVCHRDGNPTNNNLSNLYYGTHSENMADKVRHGRVYKAKGELCHTARLDRHDVQVIRMIHSHGMALQTLANIFNVSKSAVAHIVKRRSWTHV